MITWYMVGEEHDDGKSEYFENIKYVEFYESTKTSFFYVFILLVVIICIYIVSHNT